MVGITIQQTIAQVDSISMREQPVWSLGRQYVYMATYTDTADSVITQELITIHPTERLWEIDSSQTLATFTIYFDAKDSAQLAPLPLNGVQRGWLREYQEGVMENYQRIWMHPIRSNQYQLTEVAPFPEVRFPLQVGKHWSSSLSIYEGFGSFQGIVKSEYKVTNQVHRRYDFGTASCWEIETTGIHDTLGLSTAVF
ncbi:MAG: hypothetical protein ACKVOR_12080, partial [Flavobacteriales bacterium]